MSLLRSLLVSLLLYAPAFADAYPAQTILYIRGEFSDKPMGQSDGEWMKIVSPLHDTLVNYWQAHSYSKIMEITPTYTPILKIGTTEDSFDYNDLAKNMEEAARKAGFEPRDYRHVVYYYPSIRHNISFGGLGGGGKIWLPGVKPFDGGLIHEFGHSLGAGHANAIEGDTNFTLPGQRREGRDGLHMMGSDGNQRNGGFATINLPMRFRYQFFTKERLHRVKRPGVYRIVAFDTPQLPERAEDKIGIRVQVGENDVWLSFAPGMAEKWQNFPAQGFKRGIIAHLNHGAITDLLDFTPGSIGGTGNESDYVDCRDGALVVGSHFTFPGSKITIAPINVGKDPVTKRDYIDVAITYNGIPGAPEITKIGTAKGELRLENGHTVLEATTKTYSPTSDHSLMQASPCAEVDEIAAGIVRIDGATSRTQTGICIRSGTNPQSKHVSLLLDGEGKLTFVWRKRAGRASEFEQLALDIGSLTQLSLRLKRDAETITASYLDAEGDWKTLRSVEIDLGKAPIKGLTTSSADVHTPISATFQPL